MMAQCSGNEILMRGVASGKVKTNCKKMNAFMLKLMHYFVMGTSLCVISFLPENQLFDKLVSFFEHQSYFLHVSKEEAEVVFLHMVLYGN